MHNVFSPNSAIMTNIFSRKIKLITWNVNSVRVRMPLLINLIETESPDILLLQETKCENIKFPFEELENLGYNVLSHGQKTYNGVAILSRFPIDLSKDNFENNPISHQARFLEAEIMLPIGYARIISVYVPNGGEVNSESYHMKLNFFKAFSQYLNEIKKYDEFLIVGGDFNVAKEEIDVWEPSKYLDSTCFTMPERQAMRAMLNGEMCDFFRLINPEKVEFSWWDYRGSSLKKNQGLRIDTIIGSYNLTQHPMQCSIKKEWREKESPSDHAPVMLEIMMT
jgi:exodeoxyribonuclease III